MRGYRTSDDLINRCIDLRKDGLSINAICEQTGLAKSTVHYYISLIKLTPEQQKRLKLNSIEATIVSNHLREGVSRRHNHITQIPQFDVRLVRCLAHFLFDGSVAGHQVCYYNRAREIVLQQQTDTKALFGVEGKLYPQTTGVIRLVFNSVELVNLVRSQQTILLGLISSASLEWKRTFLKAFFDDEGTTRGRFVAGCQKDITVLELIQHLLADFSIPSRIYTSKTRVPVIAIIGGKPSLQRFAKDINFSPGVTINPRRKNSQYSCEIEKREILRQGLASYKR